MHFTSDLYDGIAYLVEYLCEAGYDSQYPQTASSHHPRNCSSLQFEQYILYN